MATATGPNNEFLGLAEGEKRRLDAEMRLVLVVLVVLVDLLVNVEVKDHKKPLLMRRKEI